jgi:hypothetical protein
MASPIPESPERIPSKMEPKSGKIWHKSFQKSDNSDIMLSMIRFKSKSRFSREHPDKNTAKRTNKRIILSFDFRLTIFPPMSTRTIMNCNLKTLPTIKISAKVKKNSNCSGSPDAEGCRGVHAE